MPSASAAELRSRFPEPVSKLDECSGGDGDRSARDIDDARTMTEISGDPPGTAWNDPAAIATCREVLPRPEHAGCGASP
jgi:hypothetical protein